MIVKKNIIQECMLYAQYAVKSCMYDLFLEFYGSEEDGRMWVYGYTHKINYNTSITGLVIFDNSQKEKKKKHCQAYP